MPKTVHVCSIESWAPLFALGQHIITLLVCSNIFICLLPAASGTIKLNCQDDKCLKKMSSSTVSTPTNEITTEMETKKTKLKSGFPKSQKLPKL